MFIDVTRFGGLRIQRLAVAAIAYLDQVAEGCAIHLIGGETIRVNEDVAEIEARCEAPALIAPAVWIDPDKELEAVRAGERAGVISQADAVEIRVDAITRTQPGKRPNGQQRKGSIR